MTSISASVAAYETWLGERLGTELVEGDLAYMHEKMRADEFSFLRASCFRWAETAAELCPELAGAPVLATVGDAHAENFGLWRDGEGRLVWGLNDFDEAAVIPYPFDLVRLTASVLLAGPARQRPEAAAAAKAILTGYRAGLTDPHPFILEFRHQWLRRLIVASKDRRKAFWAELRRAPAVEPPLRYRRALAAALPKPAPKVGYARRRAGTGGLGRPRFVALAADPDAPLAREAKALVPSCWAPAATAGAEFQLAFSPHRAADPWLQLRGTIVVRRLAANSHKLGFYGNQPALLEAMGFELANIHSADSTAAECVRADLATRPPNWLTEAAVRTAGATERDWRAYRHR